MRIDSTEQIISIVADSLIRRDPAPLVDTLTSNYTPFLSHYVEVDKVVSSVADLFGSVAVIHSENNLEPMVRSTAETLFHPLSQYFFVLATLLFTSIVVYKFSEHVGRLLKLAFSFPHLYRQLESANNAIDAMAHSISAIVLFLFPMLYLSFNQCYPIHFFRQDVISPFWMSIVLVVGLYLYNKVLKSLFYRFFHNRYFYRRLFIAEHICLSSYVLILLPLSLLASVPNFFQNTLIKVQFLMVIVFCIHYLLTVFKLFIEEKVSYVQLILYFCTVKAVIIGLIIYFGILWL